MKKLFLLLIFSVLCGIAYSPEYKCLYIAKATEINPIKRIWDAICFIESSNNPKAYNRVERATGIVQIRPIRLRDFNQQTGKHYKINEMFDPVKSKEIFIFYANKYNPYDYEGISREWNGKYGHTDKYWKRVKNELQRQKSKNKK